MRTNAKAGVAAAAGAALLLGGAGSMAYWTDSESPADGVTVVSGELGLGAPECGSGWSFADGSSFTPATDRVVPGDTLTRTCTMLITAKGKNLTANLTANAPTMQTAGLLDDELSFTAAWETDTNATDGDTGTSTETAINPVAGAWAFSDTDDGLYLRATLTLDFPFGVEDNGSNGGVQAILNAVTVSATQTASP